VDRPFIRSREKSELRVPWSRGFAEGILPIVASKTVAALALVGAFFIAAPAQAATPRGAERAVVRALSARFDFDSVYAQCTRVGPARFECRADGYYLEGDSAYASRGYAVRSSHGWSMRMPRPRRCGCLDTF
jgi:hypothetical protein